MSLIICIQRCVTLGDDESWRALRGLLSTEVANVSGLKVRGRAERRRFEDWLWGWVFQRRKIHVLYRALNKKAHDESTLPPSDDHEGYARNYFKTIVRSGVAEFFNERSGERHIRYQDTSALYERSASDSSIAESFLADNVDAMRRLDPEYRLPFLLRHAPDLLDDSDLAWLGDTSGLGSHEIKEQIASELDRNSGRKYPLDAEFIGRIMGIRPAMRGSSAVIDQRCKRARTKLKELLPHGKDADHDELP